MEENREKPARNIAAVDYQAWAKLGETVNKPDISREIAKTALLSAEINLKHDRAERFIAVRSRSLSTFAGNSWLKYQPSAKAKTFAFYPKEQKVEIPEKWFDGTYEDRELVFSSYHELSHFLDMKKNPEEFLKNFERMQEKAAELASHYYRQHPDQASQEAIQKFYYDELHTLYNCLDDIYVNALVRHKAPVYSNQAGRGEVVSLYQKLGFGGADLQKQPLHKQMVYALLRDEMVADELGKSQVTSDVEKILSKKRNGRSIRDRIAQDFRPKGGILVDPAERYKAIRDFIEPDYLRLLDESLKKWNEQQQQNGEGKGGNNKKDDSANPQNGTEGDSQDGGREEAQGGEFNPFGDQKKGNETFFNSGDDENTKKAAEDLVEENKVEKMSPEERAKYNKDKAQAEFDKKHNISPEARKEFESIKSKIGQARKEMQRFWNSLVGKSMEFENRILTEQRRGKLDIKSVIKYYPDFVNAEKTGNFDELNIYNRNELERVLVDKPDTIEISLLVDGSGSMQGSRMESTRAAATLMMLSIKDFNDELERRRHETHSKIHANTEVLVYGSHFERIKGFERRDSHNSRSESEAEIIASVAKMQSDYGGTDDAAPLASIREGLTSRDLERIRKGKLKKIVFEITDGGSQSAEESQRLVRELTQDGILAIAFQIGDVSEYDRGIFDLIWNSGQVKQGVFLGESEVSTLPKRLIETLSEALKDIRI